MKIVLAIVALFVAVEVKAYHDRENYYDGPGMTNNPDRGTPWPYAPQQNYHRNNGFGMTNNPGRDTPWPYAPQQNYHQNNRFDPNIEWICHNPKTDDMMIIALDNTRQNPGRGPWWQWQNLPPGQQKHNQNWRHFPQPFVIIQSGSTGIDIGNDGNQRPLPLPTTPETHNNNNNGNEPQTTPRNHGGEGLIDIRLGEQ